MITKNHIILPLAYFAPLPYYQVLFSQKYVQLDEAENYLKQTYRNRSEILGPNGIQILTVPVMAQKGNKIPTSQLTIDNRRKWQQLHWRTLQTAYGNSPYFIYYEQDIREMLNKNFNTLGEISKYVLIMITKWLGKVTEFEFLSHYEAISKNEDLRLQFKHREEVLNWNVEQFTYNQVFEDRFGFIPGLSILDLIFNTGPEASELLIR